MNINLIAAIGKNYELGKDNKLVYSIKEDLEFFKQVTLNHTVVMGRKTFESIGKPLPKRNNVVISRTKNIDDKIEIYRSIKEFLEAYENKEEDIFVIGGATIYKQFLDMADNIYLTEIDDIKPADIYFPKFDLNEYDKEIIKTNNDSNPKYMRALYKKKQK